MWFRQHITRFVIKHERRTFVKSCSCSHTCIYFLLLLYSSVRAPWRGGLLLLERDQLQQHQFSCNPHFSQTGAKAISPIIHNFLGSYSQMHTGNTQWEPWKRKARMQDWVAPTQRRSQQSPRKTTDHQVQ